MLSQELIFEEIKKYSKIKTKKAISVDIEAYDFLQTRKGYLHEIYGGRISFNMVVQELIHHYFELEKMKVEVEKLQVSNAQNTEFYKKLLEKLVSNSSPTINIGTNPGLGYGSPQVSMPPPPPPPKINPETIPEIEDIETDAELTQAFNQEKRQIFDGNIRKPSEIIQITNPKHVKSSVTIFKGKPPNLVKKSYALKHPGNFHKVKSKEL